MVPSSPRQMGGSAGASGSPWAVDMVGSCTSGASVEGRNVTAGRLDSR